METTAITLLAIFVILFYVYIKRTFRYWKDRKVVSLPVLPLVGSYGKVMTFRQHIGITMKDVYDMFPKEKYIGGFKGHKPQLVLLDPEVIRSVLVKDFNHFRDRGITVDETRILEQNLFSLSGEKWRLLRQKLTPTFTSAKMKLMFPLLVECGYDLQKFLKVSLEKTDVLEVREIMAKYTTDTIGSCAFGIRMNSMGDKDGEFRKIGKKIFEHSFYRSFMRIIISFTPKLLSFKTRSLDLEQFFVGLIKELLTTRKTPSNRHDFIDLMMEFKSKGHLAVDKNDKILQNTQEKEESIEITDELITAQAFVFFAAGFETSSTTMSYALRELALNPSIQEKLVNEIDTVLKRSEGKLTYDAVQEMHYLNMVINETLRKYPPGAILERQCNSKYRIPDTDIVLDEGVSILVPIYALHHDSKHFPNPEEFRPERFAKDAEHTIHPFAYLPFGEGPRNCIGMRFGKLQSATGLVSLLLKYKVEKCDKTQLKIDFSPTSAVMSSVDGLWMKLTARS